MKAGDLLRDSAEVVVLHLLTLGGHRPEDRAAGENEVGTLLVELAIDEEVFLLGPDGGRAALGIGDAEGGEDAQGLLVQGLDGAEEGHLLVEGVAEIRDEGRRYERGSCPKAIF